MHGASEMCQAVRPPGPSRSGQEAREMLIAEKVPLFESEIRRLVAFERAPLEGVIVKDYDDPRSSVAWLGYQQLGQEIMTQAEQGRVSNG